MDLIFSARAFERGTPKRTKAAWPEKATTENATCDENISLLFQKRTTLYWKMLKWFATAYSLQKIAVDTVENEPSIVAEVAKHCQRWQF